MTIMPAHQHTILYAEDDLDDLYIVQEAFVNYDPQILLVHAENGFTALEKLSKLYETGISPCLIILDINMPGMNGREALVRIKQSEIFKNIPVFLFTTSSSDGDKAFAKKWGADFITKPLLFNELEELAKTFVKHCLSEMSSRA